MLFRILCLFVVVGMSGGGARAVEENPFTNATPKTDSIGSGAPDMSDLPDPQVKPEFLLRMSRAECRRLLRRSKGVSARYQPNIDVRGNRVIGADLEGTLTASDILPDVLAFELLLNPVGFAGNKRLAEFFANTRTAIGSVRYDVLTGALSLNGKPLDTGLEDDLVTLCRQALGR